MPPSTPSARVAAVVAAAALLAACGTGGADPAPAPLAADPASGTRPDAAAEPAAPDAPAAEDGPHEVTVVADLGPLPDGSGDAVVETTWTVDAAGTRSLVVNTPAGYAVHHVMTDDDHWYWVHPTARESIVDAEWIHFDLREIEAAGGELPALVAEARIAVPPPGRIGVGDVVADHEVIAVQRLGADEVRLTVAGVDRPVVHRRRPLPAGTAIELPVDAVDVADLPDVLAW